MTRYVVAVKTDGYLRVFGTFASLAKASELADAINAKTKATEEAEFSEWKGKPAGAPFPGEHGRASVYPIHKPSVRRGVRFALGELDA